VTSVQPLGDLNQPWREAARPQLCCSMFVLGRFQPEKGRVGQARARWATTDSRGGSA
jgi:hypothetical protein